MNNSSLSFFLPFSGHKWANSRTSHLELIFALFRLGNFQDFSLSSTLENGPDTSFWAIPALGATAIQLLAVVVWVVAV